MNIEEIIKRDGHKTSSKIILIGIALVALALVFAIATCLILLLFPVTEIEVAGDSRYSYEEIIDASGVKIGGRLYFINERKAERRLLSSMPYLENAEVNSYFPNRVKIEISEYEDTYLVDHENGYCFVNGDFKILEIVNATPSYETFSSVFIKLENPLSGEVGDTCFSEDAQRATELVRYLKEYGFYQYLNIIDVKGKYDVSFTVYKRYKFVLGSMNDLADKMEVSFKVCFTDEFKRDENCIIDSSDKKRVVLRYITDEDIRKEFDFCEN